MAELIELNTPRLLLRQWKPDDRAPFARLNADPVAMEYFPSPLTEAQSNELADKIISLIDNRGWGMWAVEVKSDGAFIGFVGLHRPDYALPFSPCVEIGWRLCREYWGRGYATEAAREVLRFAFETLELNEVVSFTALPNRRSRAVMERIGQEDTGFEFDHPEVPAGHRLSRHILYKMTRRRWQSLKTQSSANMGQQDHDNGDTAD